jgi:hypothetical protein
VNLTCETLRELIFEHHAGELVVEVREEFELHLVKCANCLHLVESYRHTVTVVRRLPKCGLPEGVEARLREKMKRHLEGS